MRKKSVFLSVEEAYDRWSADYDAADNPMVAGAKEAVETLGPLVAGGRFCEFGCGTGRNLAAALRLGAASAVGCDISSEMLALAKRRSPAFELYAQDMTRRLPLPDGGIDCALFCLSLEHAAGLTPALAEAGRLLRPGGALAIIEIHPFVSLSGVAAHFEQGGVTVHMPTFVHTFADYINAFAGLDLHLESCREWLPTDFGGAATAKMFKRGAQCPLLVQFTLRTAGLTRNPTLAYSREGRSTAPAD